MSDITKHVFEKELGAGIKPCIDDKGSIKLNISICGHHGWVDDEMVLNRDDAIAISKHFKLTQEDINPC